MTGPLAGVRVVELPGIGPGPFAAMMLADMGADVIRVDRVTHVGRPRTTDVIGRGRSSIAVDLKHPKARDLVLQLLAGADVLIEGFRPGVAERLGLGPRDCQQLNRRLIYGRMTGWGQYGPLAARAGHDLTYIAITGALDGCRRAGELPVPPMNLLGDFGAGAMYLAFGIACALVEVGRSGMGQVIDAAITDGAASMTNFVLGLQAQGLWGRPAGENLLDTGAPFYDVYRCADGREVAVGALEPAFYSELIRLTGQGLDPGDVLSPARRQDPRTWPEARRRWAELFASRSRDEWAALLADSDACVAPVLTLEEAADHPHLVARSTYVEVDGVRQAGPAPRFSRTVAQIGAPAPQPGDQTDEILGGLGLDATAIAGLRSDGVVA